MPHRQTKVEVENNGFRRQISLAAFLHHVQSKATKAIDHSITGDHIAGTEQAPAADRETMATHIMREAEQQDLSLIVSETWMNDSGRPLAWLQQQEWLAPSKLLVIHDDTELPFGTVQLKQGGGHKGHNGIRHIMQVLDTPDFSRLRLGIGRPKHPMAGLEAYVLGKFSAEEEQSLSRVLLEMQIQMGQWLLKQYLPANT